MRIPRFQRLLQSVAFIIAVGYCTAVHADEPKLSQQDAVVIAGAYDLWKKFGEELWPGWTNVTMPLIYVTETHEFAIGFEKQPNGFASKLTHHLISGQVYIRSRTFQQNLAASFPVAGVPCVVIGTPTALESSPTQWTLTCVHEMFHVLQMSRGSFVKTATLQIGPKDDASWQLKFPFPYDDVNVMRLLHLDGYPLFLAVAGSEDKNDIRYNIGTALDARKVLMELLHKTTGDSRAYKYSMFQEWKEGIARYTEFRMAELAATRNFQPSTDMQRLDDYVSYAEVWEKQYQSQIFLIKHAGRAARSRTVFYHLGLAKGMALDRLNPNWKSSYFAPGVWLDDLLAKAAGSITTQSAIAPGQQAPDFQLRTLDNKEFKLSQLTDKVVLIDFWQPWCPPCLQAVNPIRKLRDKYSRDLVVLGVVDQLDPNQIDALRQTVHKHSIDYLTLLDTSGTTATEFGIEGYPHLFLIDRNGVVKWQHHGSLKGSWETLDKLVSELISEK